MGRALLLGSLGLLLHGCMVRKYVRPESPVATQWTEDENLPTGTQPASDIGWRDFFKNPSLQEHIEIALANNRDLRIAMLRVDRAQATFRNQFATMLPDVNLDASVTNSKRVFGPGLSSKGTIYRANVNMPAFTLDIFGQQRYATLVAQHKYFATVAGARAAHITLISEVATAWITERALAEHLEIANTLLASWTDALALQQARFDAGLASDLDLQAAQSLVDNGLATRAALQQQHATSVQALGYLMGTPKTPARTGSLMSTGVIAPLPAGLPSDVLMARPDIMAAEERLRAAHANIGAAHAAFFPQISLTASVGTASPELSGLFGAGAGVWSFVPQLLMPIFSIPANIAALRGAKVDREIAVAEYEKAIQAAFRDVATALNSREPLRQRVAALSHLTKTESKRSALAQARYDEGLVSYLNRLDADRARLNAERSLIDAHAQLLTNAVSLYASLGGGSLEHTSKSKQDQTTSPSKPAK